MPRIIMHYDMDALMAIISTGNNHDDLDGEL